MDVNAMRAILMSQYYGAKKWQDKVRNMSEKQVMAIYYRLLNSGQLRTPVVY